MKVKTDSFELTLPPAWQRVEASPNGLLAVGPAGERVQVSVAAIGGEGSSAARMAVAERMRMNARQSMEAGARESGLPLTRPLTSNHLANGLSIDEIECRSDERALLLCAIASNDAVLLLTYETENPDRSALAGYAHIVNSIRKTGSIFFQG